MYYIIAVHEFESFNYNRLFKIIFHVFINIFLVLFVFLIN